MVDSNQAGWTLETLKVHLETQIQALREYHDQSVRAQEKATNVAMKASEKAIDKAEAQTQRRLDQMTEAYQVSHQALVDSVDAIGQRLDRSEGSRSGANQFWLIIVAGISTIGVIVWTIVLITGR